MCNPVQFIYTISVHCHAMHVHVHVYTCIYTCIYSTSTSKIYVHLTSWKQSEEIPDGVPELRETSQNGKVTETQEEVYVLLLRCYQLEEEGSEVKVRVWWWE